MAIRYNCSRPTYVAMTVPFSRAPTSSPPPRQPLLPPVLPPPLLPPVPPPPPLPTVLHLPPLPTVLHLPPLPTGHRRAVSSSVPTGTAVLGPTTTPMKPIGASLCWQPTTALREWPSCWSWHDSYNRTTLPAMLSTSSASTLKTGVCHSGAIRWMVNHGLWVRSIGQQPINRMSTVHSPR